MKSFGQRARGARLERMRASPRWVGDGFRNLHPVLPGLRDPTAARPSLGDFLRQNNGQVPPAPLPSVDPRPPWLAAPGSGLRATWLGHSTVLLEMDGHRVLTDPVWGTRASPFRLLGPKRFQPVPLRLRQMPAVDVVVISHDHYDHLDYPTISALARHSAVPFVTSLGVGAHLQAWGVAPERITELDWWETHRVPGTGLEITAAPSQHFSGRSLGDRNATLWSSMVMRSERHAVFFSGDTGLTTEYASIRERLGPFDLVMLEVGAHHPAWGDIHLGPRNALQAAKLLGDSLLMPVHWGTFSLALHAWDEPVETLVAESGPLGVPLFMPRLGEPLEPAHGPRTAAWWRQPGQASAPRAASAPAAPAASPDAEPSAGHRAATDLPWPLD